MKSEIDGPISANFEGPTQASWAWSSAVEVPWIHEDDNWGPRKGGHESSRLVGGHITPTEFELVYGTQITNIRYWGESKPT